MQLAEADSNADEVRQVCAEKLLSRLHQSDFTFESETSGGTATVVLEVPQAELLAPISLILPELSVVSNAPMEH